MNAVFNANLYAMVDIILIFGGHASMRPDGGTVVQKDDRSLQPATATCQS